MLHYPLTKRKPHPDRRIDAVISLVSATNNVPKHLILHRCRCIAKAARARQLAMYLCHVVLGRPLAEVGRIFHRDRTTVSYACALIEDLRDDAVFDAQVCALESQLEASEEEVMHAAA